MNPVPGIVIYRNILSTEDQLKLINIVETSGDLKDENNKWNFLGYRGRRFSNLDKYDDYVKECMQKIKTKVEEIDESLVWKPFTHMLTLWYPSDKGVGWHVDSYGGNDGDEGAPVYSLTLGNSCIFEYKLVGTKEKLSVELHSGDIIVFGGEQRLMYHSVKLVKMDSFNLKENFNARINLTLRTCTGFTDEDEVKYQTGEYVKRLIEKKKLKS
jgi:alkylated DNA repair dioxygenase AlkB